MNALYSILGVPFGWIIWAIYQVISNYAVVLIIFTFLTKLIIYPMRVRQHKTSIKSGIMNPKIQEINKKYQKNPQKRQEETTKLQQEYGYNPRSGCLPMLLPFIVLFGVIDVVYKPLTHVLRVSSDLIEKAAEALGATTSSINYQLGMIKDIQADPSSFVDVLGQDVVNQITRFDMNLFGINLGEQPSFTWPIIIMPILAAVFSFAQMYIQQRLNPTSPEGAAGSGTMKVMLYVMPLFSLWMAFSVPAGVGFYWMLSYVFGIVEAVILYKLYDPVSLREQATLEFEENRKRNRKSTIVTTTVVEDDGTVTEKNLSQKEINRRRLAAARKADAEKYGEIYEELNDDNPY